MKKIEAFVKEEKVEEVTRALRLIEGLTGMTVLRREGFGRRHEGSEVAPTPEMIHDFRQVVRVEVFCMDALAEIVVAAIEKAAHCPASTTLSGRRQLDWPVDGGGSCR